MATEIRITMADDHPIVRQGLRRMIESDSNLLIIGEAGDGAEAFDQIVSLRPDVALVDIDMPGMDGFDVAKALRERRVSVEIVFLTIHREEEVFTAAMDLDVRGYVLKDSAVTEIVAAIKSVAAGHNYISPQLSSYLLNRSRRSAALTTKKPALADLTPTERRVLRLISESRTSKEIANEMHISARTVDNHRSNIAEKLEIHGTHSLLKFAIEHKSELS